MTDTSKELPPAAVDLLGDIIGALVRRTGGTVVELESSELLRADRTTINITTDTDGCVRVEIVTEVPNAGS